MNFATVQKLPMVVIVENNGYAYSTPTSKQSAVNTLADKAVGFGCAGVTIDGNDVLGVYDTVKHAVENARNGGGVTLIEVKTFRMKGHAEHDNQAYVPKELIAEWQEKDAVVRFEKMLVERGIATDEKLAGIQQRVKREIDEATDEAERSPMPNPADAARGLYIEDGYWNG
jgi:TPP-dependent pyruvate/acetoin dehydrogenase alpha subunit